jgi:hypothetical protein
MRCWVVVCVDGLQVRSEEEISQALQHAASRSFAFGVGLSLMGLVCIGVDVYRYLNKPNASKTN